MTIEDLKLTGEMLYSRNDLKALQDRTLLSKQWFDIDRSSDDKAITYNDLHWQDSSVLIDIIRYVIVRYLILQFVSKYLFQLLVA